MNYDSICDVKEHKEGTMMSIGAKQVIVLWVFAVKLKFINPQDDKLARINRSLFPISLAATFPTIQAVLNIRVGCQSLTLVTLYANNQLCLHPRSYIIVPASSVPINDRKERYSHH